MSDILTAANATKLHQQERGIHQASLSVRKGEIVGVVGANGAGKTTLINLIVGVAPPMEGSIHINGYDIRKAPIKARLQLGFVPDAPEVIEKITVWEFLSFIGITYNLRREVIERRGSLLLDLLSLDGSKDDLMGTLSHGMRKKVQIAAALLHRPSLLVMDEPTNGLDPTAILLLRDVLLACKESGQGVLLATHNLSFADEICDEIHIINNARIVASGAPKNLKQEHDAGSLNDVYLKVTGGGWWRDKIAHVMGS